MPTKRTRRTRARRGSLDEARAWAMSFKSGHDYFGDLEALGYGDWRDARDAARDAWKRLGALYLLHLHTAPDRCWALDQFGPPPMIKEAK